MNIDVLHAISVFSYIAIQSVVCLSVTLVHGTQPVEIFGNFSSPFDTCHPLTSTENFTEIVSGEPLRRGGGLNARGVAKYSDFIERSCSLFRYAIAVPSVVCL